MDLNPTAFFLDVLLLCNIDELEFRFTVNSTVKIQHKFLFTPQH